MKQVLFLACALLLWINGYSQITGWQAAWTYPQYPAGHTSAHQIIQDRAGNIYALGNYRDSFYQHAPSGFLIKYSPTGQLIWRKDFTGYGIRTTAANCIGIDSLDRIYVAGNYGLYNSLYSSKSNLSLLIDTLVQSDTAENGSYNGFLFCLDTSGHRKWSKFLNGDSAASIISLSVNKAGDIALIGSYLDAFRLGSLMVTQPPGGQQRYFITRLNSSGDAQMLRGAYRNKRLNGCYINNEREIFVSGVFSGWTQFDSIRLNSQSTGAVIETGFVVKFDSTGAAKWVKGVYGHMPPSGPSVFGTVSLWNITEQPNGNIILTGDYYTCSVSAGNRQFALPFSGQNTPFIICLDSSGNPVWIKGAQPEVETTIGRAVSDTANNIYCTGSTYDPTIWGSDTVSWGNTTLRTDAFLYKLNPLGKLLWARFAGSSGHDGGGCPLLTAGGTAVYIAGVSEGPDSMNFGSFKRPTAGVFTLFVAKTGTEPLSVESIPKTSAFPVTLFPNPAGETLSVKIPEKVQLKEVLVVDVAGQVRLQMTAPPNHGSEVRVPVGLLSPGQYFLVLTAKDGSRAVQSFTRF